MQTLQPTQPPASRAPVTPVTLADAVVALEPLAPEHAEPLWAAAASRRETFSLTRVPTSLEDTRAYVEQLREEQARGVTLPFATRDLRRGALVGATRFMTLERWTWPPPGSPLQRGAGELDALEIGGTWLAAEAQRTAINTHAKRLMLTHAFEVWQVRRVMLKTDARNQRSRSAIQRLGASFDGVLRAHMPAFDGSVRDTAFYSIVAAEWPAVRARLEELTSSASAYSS